MLDKLSNDEKNVILKVCARYNVEPESIFERKKDRLICEPRQIILSLFRVLLGIPLSGCVKEFRMDHTNVFGALKTVNALCTTDPIFRARIEQILCDLGTEEADRILIVERFDYKRYLSGKQKNSYIAEKRRKWKESNRNQLTKSKEE